MSTAPEVPQEVDSQARELVDSLRTGAGWRKEHGRISRTLIVRASAPELKPTEQAYERAVAILLEQGYAASYYCRRHGDELCPTGYVELGICIGR